MLPLDNYSGDPKEDYFAEGMTDELTTDLVTISRLRVISRGSTMEFKDKGRPPTPEIAKLLNVDTVVEGSIGRADEKVRITARDALALQGELASAIAGEINVRVTPSEQARLTSGRSVNPASYDAYLKRRYFFNRPSDETLSKAIAQSMEAPPFATAWLGYAYGADGERELAVATIEELKKKPCTVTCLPSIPPLSILASAISNKPWTCSNKRVATTHSG